MATDSDRAIFVREEYRREIATDPMVKARNPTAQEIYVDTQLGTLAEAASLASRYLGENKQPRTFRVSYEGTASFQDFVGSCPAAILNSLRLKTDGRTLKVFEQTVDYDNNTTTVLVRG